jgi:hypothetical protein
MTLIYLFENLCLVGLFPAHVFISVQNEETQIIFLEQLLSTAFRLKLFEEVKLGPPMNLPNFAD